MTTDVRPMQQIIAEHGQAGWQLAWDRGFTPWEVETGHQPALKRFLESDVLSLPRAGRALVPGCGRGYDAILLGEMLGLDVLGADLSETGIAAAKELLAKSGTTASVRYHVCDFFKYELEEGAPKFVLAYDFTFFVAIPPELRVQWGAQMNALLAPGALLITLIWPLGPSARVGLGGPPHSVFVQTYAEALGAAFEKVYEVPAEGTMEGRVDGASSALVVWRKTL